MKGLISKFGKDYFVGSLLKNPEFEISDGFEEYVYINGVCLNTLTPSSHSHGTIYQDPSLSLYWTDETPKTYIFHIHINTCEKPFTLKIQTDGDSHQQVVVPTYYTIDYIPQLTYGNDFVKTSKMLDTNTSYELLRANPKLTGNVKVVVSSDGNLYLDTFKASKGLSQRKYRKIKINPDEYYGRTLMSKMASMPSTDFYKIEDSCYDIFSLSNNLGEQYYDLYNSGVRTNGDKLYSENYSILAPLVIKKNMPDFFIVFKVSGYETLSTNTEKINNFLSKGEIVKVFDLRNDSDAGKLMRKMYENAKDFTGDLYIPYDYNQNNIYNGISLDRGEVAEIYESAALCRQIKNQVAMNDWFTLGFERNRIVSKDIINFEFMFDDLSEDLFTINTYFGIYVRLNGEKQDFNCLGFNEKYYPVFNEEIHGTEFDPSDEQFTDLIYGLSAPDGFTRLTTNISSNDPINVEILSKYAGQPYQNIVSPSVVETDPDTINKCYAYIKFNDMMDVGEHFRIIDDINKKIHEVVLSNFENDEFDISEINYYQETINSDTYSIERVTIYGIPYRNEIQNEQSRFTKEDEINLLSEAFNSFGEDIIQSYINDDNLCLIYNTSFSNGSNSVYIEKVSSFYDLDASSVLYTEYDDKSAYIFGQGNNIPIYVDAVGESGFRKLIYPSGFESLGKRVVYVYSFVPFNTGDGYRLFHIGKNIDREISKETDIVYRSEWGYTLIDKISIYEAQPDGTLNEIRVDSIPGFGGDGTSLIQISDDPVIVEGKILIYNLCPLNAGLFSILQVKDINTDIIDTQGKVSSKNSDYISNTGGEFTSNKNIFGKRLITGNVSEESVMNYFDKYERFTEYTDSSGNTRELSTSNGTGLTLYLSTIKSANHKYSDVAITSPYCCKWKTIGTDSRGEHMRIMHEYPDAGSYFIPENNDFYIGNVTVSDGSGYVDGSFDSCTYGYPKYLNDKFDPRTHGSFRDYLFYGKGSVDELLSNIGGGSAKMATAYTHGNDAIEFISGGIKLQIQLKSTEFMNIKKYVGYSSIIICSSGNNPNGLNPCEILFDEVNEQISVFIYNGSAPWQMFYNTYNAKKTIDGAVVIPNIYPVFHTTSMSKCRTSFIDDVKVSLVQDDSNMWRKDEVDASYPVNITLPSDTSNGFCYMLSSVIDEESFTKEKLSLLTGKVNSNSLNDDFKNEYLATWDSCLFIDSERMEPYYSQFKKSNNRFDDNIDFFIMSGLYESYGKIKGETDYATLPLWKIKEIVKSPMIYVKTENKTYNYSGLNDLFNIEIKEANTVNIENTDFEVINTGLAYPSYCEPVTRDMFVFENSIPSINSYFNTDFEGCNLRIGNVNTIPQVWLRKVSNKSLTADLKSNGSIPINTYNDYFEIDGSANLKLNKGTVLVSNTDYSTHTIIDTSLYTKSTTILKANSSNAQGFDNDAGIINQGTSVEINGEQYTVLEVLNSSINGPIDGKYYYINITFEIGTDVVAQSGEIITVEGGGVTLVENSEINYETSGEFITEPVDEQSHFSQGDYVSLSIQSSEIVDDSSFFATLTDESPTIKYEETSLSTIVSTTGFSVLHDMNPMVNCWRSNMYRIFNGLDDFTEINGIESGYEKNTFFTSRGISLKHKDSSGNIDNFIEISKWENSIIDEKNRTIRLNITDTLIKYIMYSDGYVKNWTNRRVKDPSNKQRYIENSILKYINIDETCPIEIKSEISGKLCLNDSDEFESRPTEEGVDKKLYNENGKYYLLLENLKDYKYTVKMKIYI